MTLAANPNVATYYSLKGAPNKTVKLIPKSIELGNFQSLEEFSQQLANFIQRSTSISLDNKHKKKKVESVSHRPSAGLIPQEMIFAALEKCATNEEFWCKTGLDILLSNNCITPGINDDVVFQLIWKYKAYSSFKEMAKSYQIVPEKYILQSLKCLLKNVPLSEAVALHTKLENVDDDFRIPAFVLDLSYIVFLPVNVALLKDYMKLLTVDEALVLLHCYHFLLHVVSPALPSTCRDAKNIDGDVMEKRLITWLDLILTAHLVVFTTTPTLVTAVSDIRKTLSHQKAYYEQIGKLTSYLEYINKSKTLPEKIIGDYSIETITL